MPKIKAHRYSKCRKFRIGITCFQNFMGVVPMTARGKAKLLEIAYFHCYFTKFSWSGVSEPPVPPCRARACPCGTRLVRSNLISLLQVRRPENLLSSTDRGKEANRDGHGGKGHECNNILNGFSFVPSKARAVASIKGVGPWGGGEQGPSILKATCGYRSVGERKIWDGAGFPFGWSRAGRPTL